MSRTRLFLLIISLLAIAFAIGCRGVASSPTQIQNMQLAVSTSGSGTITSAPSGINCPNTCSSDFPNGSQVTLTATPSGSGTGFTGWGGACSGTAPTCTVTLSANQNVTASFGQGQNNFQLAVSTSGSGTITSAPAGISCPSTCSASFAGGTQVTLTETAGSGFGFTGWGGACSGTASTCTVTLAANQNVSASFQTQQTNFQLTVTTSGTAVGTVVSSPTGIRCPGTCTATFATGTAVTLTETPGAPNTFSMFAGWGGACAGTATTCNVTLSSDQNVSATFNPAINHIIFMAQENRGFEHYFGELRQYWANNGFPDQSYDGLPQFNPAAGQPPLLGPPPTNPGCDPAFPPPADCTVDANSPEVTSFEMVSMCEENPSPSWNESHADFNREDPESGTPLLDGYVWTSAHDARALGYYDVDGIRGMSYYTSDQLPFYYFMASSFATSDAWHSPAMTRTQPNRLYMLAATSAGHAYPPTSTLSNPTIFDLLEAANISWKVYVTDLSRAPKPEQDSALNFFETAAKYPNNIVPGDQFFTDLTNGTLPSVAYIEPGYDAGLDEHPGVDDGIPGANIQFGAHYVSEIMNALMQSSSWKDSAFVLTYDEFGGFHDHVAPQPTVSPDGIKPIDLQPGDICNKGTTGPTCDFVYTGYRVPLIVVSPFSKKNYVSHTVGDYTAWLKLVETRFGLPNLTARDAAQFDMTEFFDFVNIPWAVPPTPPVQPENGQCYVNKLP